MGSRSSQLRKFENHTILENEWDGSVLRATPAELGIVGGGDESAILELRTVDGAPVVGETISIASDNPTVASPRSTALVTDANGQAVMVVDGIIIGFANMLLSYPNDNQGAGKVRITVS